MTADISEYLRLITSEHRPRPKFTATVSLLVQPLADQVVLADSIPSLYDLDVTVGEQEDVVGQWVGRSRFIDEPIEGVYFSFDTQFVGFDEGTWWQKFDSTVEVERLPDDAYRQLLRAKIQGNIWDGTIPDAYTAWETLFVGQGVTILIQDYQDMTMLLAFWGKLPNALTRALVVGGYLGVRPAGVGINYMIPTIEDYPYFGFDTETKYISGFDEGAWGNPRLNQPILVYMVQASAILSGEASMDTFAGPYPLLSPAGLAGEATLLCDAGGGAGLAGLGSLSVPDALPAFEAAWSEMDARSTLAVDALEYPYRLSGTLGGVAEMVADTTAFSQAYGTLSGQGFMICFANVAH